MKKLSQANPSIGYVPYLPDLSQPGDRRRFPYFAKRSNIEFEIANPSKEYDIILLTAPSNLTLWMDYKRRHPKTKFLFEMVDSLVFSSSLLYSVLKGTARYFLGMEKKLFINYKVIIDEWIKIADGVICSNKTLLQYVFEKNKNAFLSPDYLESEYSLSKTDFKINGKMKIIWEGQSSVLPHFLAYDKVFEAINDFCELHIISNNQYPVIPKIYNTKIEKFLKRLPIETYFINWDLKTHNEELIKGDCAIIPLNKKNRFGWYKPANKLVSFWFCKLPSIVSATPAYLDLMRASNQLEYCCYSKEQWVTAIKNMYSLSENERRFMAEQNYKFVQNQFSDKEIDKTWQNIFASLNRKELDQYLP